MRSLSLSPSSLVAVSSATCRSVLLLVLAVVLALGPSSTSVEAAGFFDGFVPFDYYDIGVGVDSVAHIFGEM